MEVLVVGAGAMGQWVGRVFTERESSLGESSLDLSEGLDIEYYDEQPEAARDAATQIGGDAVTTVKAEYDVVCVAVPIPVATQAIADHAHRARRAVFDVTGTMNEPVAALNRHAPEVERCSLHPLFAPANEPGNVPVVLDADGPVTRFLREVLEDRGNNVFETTPAEHDEAMKTVQSRAHAAILAYGLASETVPERFQTTVSGELEALLRQVSSGEARVYGDIQAAFDGADDVAEAAATLAEADRTEFEQLYNQIRRDGDTE